MKKIAIPVFGFIEWGGGIDFVKYIIDGLVQLNKNEVRLFILIPQKQLPIKNLFYKAIRLIMRKLPILIKDYTALEKFRMQNKK